MDDVADDDVDDAGDEDDVADDDMDDVGDEDDVEEESGGKVPKKGKKGGGGDGVEEEGLKDLQKTVFVGHIPVGYSSSSVKKLFTK